MIYFILSCARSGSTSLCRIFDTAENGICLCEPQPNLGVETRMAMDGLISQNEYIKIIKKTIYPRIIKKKKKVEIYGEKNVTYAPFLEALYEVFNCKFIFLKRDGRDAVRSMINWHNEKFGNYYWECSEVGKLSKKARKARKKIPREKDICDYTRPRPSPGEAIFNEWNNLTRLEMCAWYWSKINNIYLNNLKNIPDDKWMEINYSSETGVIASNISKAFVFLGLKRISKKKITSMLSKKINSLSDRGDSAGSFPHWSDWTEDVRDKFDRIASSTMISLGYYNKDTK